MQSLLWTCVLSLLLWVGVGNAECVFPDENGNLPKQHIVVIDRIPVHLSAAICSNTTISVAGTTVPVTNAPTVLLTDFIVENTITLTSTLLARPIQPHTDALDHPLGVSTTPSVYDSGPSAPGLGGETAFPRSLIVITAPWTGSVTNTVLLPPRRSDEVGTRILLTPASEPFTGSLTAVTQPWTGMVPTTITLPARGTDTIGTELVLTPIDPSAPTDPPLARSFTTMTGVWTGTALSTVDLPPAGGDDSIGTRILLRPTTEGGESDPAPSPRLFIDITGTGTGTDPTTITIPPAETGTLTIATRLILNPATTPGSAGITGSSNRPLDPFGRLFIPPETGTDDRFITITSTTTGADPTTLTLLPTEIGGTGTAIVFDTLTVTVTAPTGGLGLQTLLPTSGGSVVSTTTPGGPINPAELVDGDSSAVSSSSGLTSGPVGNNILTSPEGGSGTNPVPDVTSTPFTQPALLTSDLDVPATSTTTDPGLPRLLLTTTSSAPATSDSDPPIEPFEFPDDEVHRSRFDNNNSHYFKWTFRRPE
ncbi:60s ribosomal protein L19 [Colletotrichum higginsianum]|nr:60s ribosomal protein L19 [Colletotrichum higginsianum]